LSGRLSFAPALATGFVAALTLAVLFVIFRLLSAPRLTAGFDLPIAFRLISLRPGLLLDFDFDLDFDFVFTAITHFLAWFFKRLPRPLSRTLEARSGKTIIPTVLPG
jgi:hypothetical protein